MDLFTFNIFNAGIKMTLEPQDMAKIENVIQRVADEITSQQTTKIETAIKKTIDERFTAYGFDIKAPLEIQKDQAFSHKWRLFSEQVANKMVLLFLAGMVGLFTLLKFVLPLKGK
jgi:hypothetical protein